MTDAIDDTERLKISVENPEKSGTELQADTSLSKPSTQPLGNWFHQHIVESELRAALDRFGFTQPTPVQEQTLPAAMTGADLVIQSKTGSGKTLAYLLPLFERLLVTQVSPKQTFALIVSPTRELAVQIVDVASKLSNRVAPVCAIGGADLHQQVQALQRDARIVVGTPGRLLEMLRERHLRLNTCRYFVLDEADEMLSMGFLEDVRAILARLPDKRQGLFVSATITPRVDMLANSFLTKAQAIVIETPEADRPSIEHLYCDVAGDLMAKPSALCDLIETLRPRSAIIFCNTKSDTRLVEALLRRRGFDARRINSDLTQAQRDKIMKKIRAMDLQFLVATDVAARGLDMEQIDLVVNFSIHEQPETYVHRTGRTGRAGRTGKAISLVGPKDFGYFHHLTKVLSVNFQKLPLPSEQDLTSARLNHIYELLRAQPLEPRPQDMDVVRAMFRDTGSEGTLSEEFEAILAKLCRHIVENAIKEETKSLDEELDGESPSETRPQASEDSSDRKRSRRDRRRSDRDGEERRERPARGRDERGQTTDESRSDAPAASAAREGNDRRQESGLRYRGDDTVRIFISSGSEEGMNEGELRALLTDFAGLEPAQLQSMSLRDHHTYADVFGRDARTVIENLNGIEYHGATLRVEIATVFANRERREDSDRGRPRRDNRDRRDRGQHHSRDRHRR